MAFTRIKTGKEIENMRASGRMLATVLKFVSNKIEAGITTAEIDTFAREELSKLGGKPAFLGYQGFTGAICTSVNQQVVHGIPGKLILQNGDNIGLDFGVNYNGMITDAAITVPVGEVTSQVSKLILDTKDSLYAGISVLKNGVKTGDIGHAVEELISPKGYGIVRDLVGHGVGHDVHEEPNIPNYGNANTGTILKEGMTICIEPMITLGGHAVYIDNDGWTVITSDQSISAHFEHTILITSDGYEILTELPD